MRFRTFALKALGALVVSVVVALPAQEAVPAQAATSASLVPSFSPDRLGAKGSVTFSIHYSGEYSGFSGPSLNDPLVPEPVSRLVVHFPAGMGPDLPSLRSCTTARLLARGARGCPAATQLGSGYALTEVHPSTLTVTEDISLQAFVGPLQGGHSTLVILGRGYSPLEERVVFTGELLFGHAPYGEELVMSIPPIPTLPMEPAASTVDFTLTIGSHARHSSGHANAVIVPSRCPVGGFPFAAEFTYADGSTGSAIAAAPCP
jgi:hypothetical protein